MPSPELTPLQAVTVQLDAMQQNDTPWPNHGVQTMYTFAEDCGSMERSRYFGFSKDLYHLDHFLGAVKIACAALVDCQAYTILTQPLGEEEQALASVMQGLDPLPEGMHAVYVRVGADAAGAPGGVFEFRLVQRQQGLRAGCWMVKSCRRVVPS